jgi:hypothetical protein
MAAATRSTKVGRLSASFSAGTTIEMSGPAAAVVICASSP